MYPRDIEKCPRPWAQERYRRIVRWNAPECGGHFPSLEVPQYFVKDLREGLAAVSAAGLPTRCGSSVLPSSRDSAEYPS
jgi:hypothetical protein